jgi:hypothetical protein
LLRRCRRPAIRPLEHHVLEHVRPAALRFGLPGGPRRGSPPTGRGWRAQHGIGHDTDAVGQGMHAGRSARELPDEALRRNRRQRAHGSSIPQPGQRLGPAMAQSFQVPLRPGRSRGTWRARPWPA